MKAGNFFKTTLGKLAIAAALVSPLALTACDGFDLGLAAGYAGADVGGYALGSPYYGNSCFAANYDYYCDNNWSGWNDFGFGGIGAPVGGPIAGPIGGVGCGADLGCDVEPPTCQPAPQVDCGMQTEYFGRKVRVANARVIAGGLRIKYHISPESARRLGYAFAAARKNNPRPLMAIGFSSADLAALKSHQALPARSVVTISRNIGVSPRTTQRIIVDLEHSYVRHAR